MNTFSTRERAAACAVDLSRPRSHSKIFPKYLMKEAQSMWAPSGLHNQLQLFFPANRKPDLKPYVQSLLNSSYKKSTKSIL